MGCRRVAEPAALVRVVRHGDGIRVGRTLPGRGAWLCAGSPSCLDLALRRKALGRALRGPVGQAGLDDLRAALGRPPGSIGGAGGDRRHW